MSMFRARVFQGVRFDPFKAPRRPRHPLLRWTLGFVGVALLVGLLFVSVFVGIAMLSVGLLVRAWKRRGTRIGHGGALPGDYRVMAKTQLPLAR